MIFTKETWQSQDLLSIEWTMGKTKEAILEADRLIHHAPEMLEMLLEVAGDIEAYCEDHNSDNPTDVTVCLHKLRSIIDRVEG